MLLKIQGMGETHIIEFTGNITYKILYFELTNDLYDSLSKNLQSKGLHHDKAFILDFENIIANKVEQRQLYYFHLKIQKDINDVFGTNYTVGGGYEIYLMNNNGKTIQKIN